MTKLGWTLALVFALTTAALGYFFILKGNAFLGKDGRTAIVLTEEEKAHVLGEMRMLLEGVQSITGDIAQNNMDGVAEAASGLGMAVANADSPALLAKLPIEVKTLGLATHAAFDDLAAAAKTADDPNAVLQQLSDIMLNCVACHQGYRIAIKNVDE